MTKEEIIKVLELASKFTRNVCIEHSKLHTVEENGQQIYKAAPDGWFNNRLAEMILEEFGKDAIVKRQIDIDKACEWIKHYAVFYISDNNVFHFGECISDFRKAMEE